MRTRDSNSMQCPPETSSVRYGNASDESWNEVSVGAEQEMRRAPHPHPRYQSVCLRVRGVVLVS